MNPGSCKSALDLCKADRPLRGIDVTPDFSPTGGGNLVVAGAACAYLEPFQEKKKTKREGLSPPAFLSGVFALLAAHRRREVFFAARRLQPRNRRLVF